MLTPPGIHLYHGSIWFSIAFLSYDRGQTTATTRHCSSFAVAREVYPPIDNASTQKVFGCSDKDEATLSSKIISLLDLPLEFLHNITTRLVVVAEYRNLHASCKTFKSTTPLITSATP
ncbi:unnamed protein product [Linum trigynum]|uniref:F-box domain-containing protein n=1 Tax=Linum trigynum TaxID=586398 RepID=A0AAV2DUT5_9ROSI